MTLLKSICLLQLSHHKTLLRAKYGFGITGTINIPKEEASKKQFMTANHFDAVFILIHLIHSMYTRARRSFFCLLHKIFHFNTAHLRCQSW